MSLTIGVDVGGTKIAGGVVNEDGEIIAMARKPTPASDPASTASTIVAVIEELRRSYDVSAVGMGCAGFVDLDRRKIIFAPNVNWRDEPLADKVEAATNLPVLLENDANAAAWGEFQFGAGRDHDSTITVTVGTGIGGGIILNGQLVRGSFGFAGEIGHMNMVPDGLLCGCGKNGCWEAYASGNSLVRRGKEFVIAQMDDPDSRSRLFELSEGDPEKLTGKHVTQAASEGDASAVAVFNEIGKWIGQGLADLSAILDPEIFILAGGVSEAGDLLLRPSRASFESRITAGAHRPHPPVIQAQLGNDAGMIGAADLARSLI